MPRDAWTQTTLLPPEVMEGVLRLGLIGATDHAQLQLELRSATDDVLLAMKSRPHVRVDDFAASAHELLDELIGEMLKRHGPF